MVRVVFFATKPWQFNSKSQSASKAASDSGRWSFACGMFQTVKTNHFIATHGQVCSKRNEGRNKDSSEVISLHWIQPSGFTLSSLNGQNATGRTRLKENKPAKCTGRETREKRQEKLDAKLLFFSFGKEWMMNYNIQKVINVSSSSAIAKFLGHLQRQEGFIGPSSSLFMGSRRHPVDTEGLCSQFCLIPLLLAQSSYQFMQQPCLLSFCIIKHHSVSWRGKQQRAKENGLKVWIYPKLP